MQSWLVDVGGFVFSRHDHDPHWSVWRVESKKQHETTGVNWLIKWNSNELNKSECDTFSGAIFVPFEGSLYQNGWFISHVCFSQVKLEYDSATSIQQGSHTGSNDHDPPWAATGQQTAGFVKQFEGIHQTASDFLSSRRTPISRCVVKTCQNQHSWTILFLCLKSDQTNITRPCVVPNSS